jgi:phage baseplate assembly protein W
MNHYWDFPYRIDGSGHTARTNQDDHIRDLIYQVLFTVPGERVNRPDFGCGLKHMTFMPNGSVLATATQYLVQGALTRWLASIIKVVSVDVTASESSLTVRVVYSNLSTGAIATVQFTPPGAPS